MAKQEKTLGVMYVIHACMAASKMTLSKKLWKVTKEGKMRKRKHTAMRSLRMRLSMSMDRESWNFTGIDWMRGSWLACSLRLLIEPLWSATCILNGLSRGWEHSFGLPYRKYRADMSINVPHSVIRKPMKVTLVYCFSAGALFVSVVKNALRTFLENSMQKRPESVNHRVEVKSTTVITTSTSIMEHQEPCGTSSPFITTQAHHLHTSSHPLKNQPKKITRLIISRQWRRVKQIRQITCHLWCFYW